MHGITCGICYAWDVKEDVICLADVHALLCLADVKAKK